MPGDMTGENSLPAYSTQTRQKALLTWPRFALQFLLRDSGCRKLLVLQINLIPLNLRLSQRRNVGKWFRLKTRTEEDLEKSTANHWE